MSKLQDGQERTRNNDAMALYMCVNYGGRAEIAADARVGRIDPEKINEKTLTDHLYYPDMPDVGLFVRPSGEQRTSNYRIRQSAYAVRAFQDVLWPDLDRRHLLNARAEYASSDRRVGGALPNEDVTAELGDTAAVVDVGLGKEVARERVVRQSEPANRRERPCQCRSTRRHAIYSTGGTSPPSRR